MSRLNQSEYSDEATIVFAHPIEIIVAYIGENPIKINVKQITGHFALEWFWTKNGRQNKIANGFEVYFNIEKYEE